MIPVTVVPWSDILLWIFCSQRPVVPCVQCYVSLEGGFASIYFGASLLYHGNSTIKTIMEKQRKIKR